MSSAENDQRIALSYYSDVLCVWAHIAQVRVDQVEAEFSAEVSIDYRFVRCLVIAPIK